AGKSELAALFQFLDDRVHQVARRPIGRRARQIDRLLQNLREERFGHDDFPMLYAAKTRLKRAAHHRIPSPAFAWDNMASADSRRLACEFMVEAWIRPVASVIFFQARSRA